MSLILTPCAVVALDKDSLSARERALHIAQRRDEMLMRAARLTAGAISDAVYGTSLTAIGKRQDAAPRLGGDSRTRRGECDR